KGTGPDPDRGSDGETREIRTPQDATCPAFVIPDRARRRPAAASRRGRGKGDDRGGGRPTYLQRMRETLVPPEMLVRRSHIPAERSGAPTHSPRGGPADGARSSRRAKTAGNQSGSRDDLEDEDAGAARERHLAGKARHRRLQRRHHAVRHDAPPSD